MRTTIRIAVRKIVKAINKLVIVVVKKILA